MTGAFVKRSLVQDHHRAVLALVAPELAVPGASVRLGPVLNDPKVLEFAQRAGVEGLVADRLLGGVAGPLSTSVRRAAIACRLRTESRVGQYAGALKPVFEALSEQGVPTVLLKGGALVGSLYPPGARRLGDVDLLISPDDYEVVSGALKSSGFELALEGATESEMRRDSHEISFVKAVPGAGLHIDLHWALTHPSGQQFCLSTAKVMARAVPASGLLQPALAARREDIFLHLATQIVGDGGRFDLPRVVDLAALIFGELDWADVLEVAREAEALNTVYIALALAGALGASPPAEVKNRLEGMMGRPARAIAELLADESVLCGCLRMRRGTSVAVLPLGYARKRDGLFRLARSSLRKIDGKYDLQLSQEAPATHLGQEVLRRTQVLSTVGLLGTLLLCGPRWVGPRWRSYLMQVPKD